MAHQHARRQEVVFEITIPGDADGLVRVDELKAVKGQ